jgi:hypothetical protein
VEKLHAKRLLRLADFLRTVPARQFNMSYWFDQKKGSDVCKTAACACGWACSIPSFRKAGLRLELHEDTDGDEKGRTATFVSGTLRFSPRTAADDMECGRVNGTFGPFRGTLEEFSAAEAFFGLSGSEASDLFSPYTYDKYYDVKIPRRAVISRIRNLVKEKRPDVLKAWDQRKRAKAAA